MRAAAACLSVGACICLFGCGSSAVPPATSVRTPRSDAATTTTSAAVVTTTATVSRPRPRPRPPAPNPGSLPQTDQLPTADTAAFRAEMKALWAAVQTDSVTAGLPAFFPELAYEQLKQIGNAASDWEGRLVADYGLDIGAAHALLGANAQQAVLVGVQVPSSYAHWIDPGVCYNSLGYYEMPNARVVYSEGGAVHSFGIASMISWRGVWYVVHLGAILRNAAAGVVDDPSDGAGASVPSSTC